MVRPLNRQFAGAILILSSAIQAIQAESPAVRSKTGMVVSASAIASQVGAQTLAAGGTAVDAAVATAFALAVTYPAAGNLGGGGFLLYRSTTGQAVAYDFREAAPVGASPNMFLTNGQYSSELHHWSYLSVGVPGTVAGLYLAWNDQGTRHLPWNQLVAPAIRLARDGFAVSDGLACSLKETLIRESTNEAALAQFTQSGKPYSAGDTLKQPVLAETLERIAQRGAAGFYEGETARAIEKDMRNHGGLITLQDLKDYKAQKRTDVIKGTYRGYEVISMPPPSSGGIGLVEMLNILEGYDLPGMGWGSATNVHRTVEAMKRAYADRAHYLGDPYSGFNQDMPLARLVSKEYAAELRKTISDTHSSASSTDFAWPNEGEDTTHLSVVDAAGNAVSMTYTLEEGYGLRAVVPGAGFLLNNELGDFNPVPGLTTTNGLIGTPPNLAQPRKRPLSSMTPTILAKDRRLFMVTGSPGGRTIINTVLQTILNVVDFGMNAQETVDAGRFYHQWLPDEIAYEESALSTETIQALKKMGHGRMREMRGGQGLAEVIIFNSSNGISEAGVDRRQADGGAAVPKKKE